MHPIEAFVRHPVKVAVGCLLVTLFGLIGMLRMPKQLTPEISVPVVQIETRWRGASPIEVEREIIQEQEKQLQSVQGVAKMSAECMDSLGRIQLQFQVGTNIQEALVQVNSRLAQVPDYPADADQPVILLSDASNETLATFMLTPRLPQAADVTQFQQNHPRFAELIEPIRRASLRNTGLATLLMRRLAARHDQLQTWVNEGFQSDSPSNNEIRALGDRFQELRDDATTLLAADPGERVALLKQLLDMYAILQELLTNELLPDDIDIPQLLHFTENHIESRFERIPGIAKSETWGGKQIELQVIVDPYKLAARNLTIMDLRSALSRNNTDTSAGDFREGKRRWVVRTIGQYRSIEEVEQQIIGVWDGHTVYVRDVAVNGGVRIGFKKPDGMIRRYGEPALAIRATRTPGSNVLETMKAVKEAAHELNNELLANEGLELTQVGDRSEYVDSALRQVALNLAYGGVLTIIVLLMFLRSGRSTVIISMAIPTSLVGTFLVMNLLGRSLNVVSIAGLAFAIGMLVDNSVVVLENIYRRWQGGEPAFAAAVHGTREVWGAIMASTLTTLAVFLPVLLIQEESGQLFFDIALAVSSAVALSLIVSITLVPTAAARLLSQRPGPESSSMRPNRLRLLTAIDASSATLMHTLQQLNAWVQQRRVRQWTVVTLLVGSSITLTCGVWPKVDYLPTGNVNSVRTSIFPPAGYDLSELMAIGEEVETALHEYWSVDPSSPHAEQLPYPAIGDWFFTIQGRRVLMGFRAADPDRAWELVPLIRELNASIPGTIVTASQSSIFQTAVNSGHARSIDIEVSGPQLERLVDLGRQIMSEVSEVLVVERQTPEGRQRVAAQAFPVPSLDLANPEVHVVPKAQQLAEMKLDIVDLGYTVDALVDGAYASDYYFGGEKIDLTILAHQQLTRRTQDLESLPVAAGNGRVVPLAALADVQLSSGPEQINRRERQRAITIRVLAPIEMPLQEAVERVTREVVQPLRDGGRLFDQQRGERYRISLSGTADKLSQTWRALRWNLLLALLITYLLMAALFESWAYPLVVIFSVPLAAVGGILGLHGLNLYNSTLAYLVGAPIPPPQSLDVLSMLGFVLLIGASVNNAILIVHQSLNHMRLEGMTSGQAVLHSVRSRTRPIFMTAATTCFGLAPLVFIPGAGSELYRGLGSIVLGGLLMSTIFTLLLVPTVFNLMLDISGRLRRAASGDAAPIRMDDESPAPAARESVDSVFSGPQTGAQNTPRHQ